MDSSGFPSHSASPATNGGQPAVPADRISRVGAWTLHQYDVVSSTNLVAAGLPAWSAVQARTQTAGRGRFQRNWISDEGGLWVSAVLAAGEPAPARAVCLLAGLVLFDLAQALGVPHLRLRWPNDLLAANRKLAGILVDRFNWRTVVLGIGLNVKNRPEAADASLLNQTARLADLMDNPPNLDELTRMVLDRIASEWTGFVRSGCALPVQRLNSSWGAPRQVELDLDGTIVRGAFGGVDAEGRLILRTPDGGMTFYAAHQVRHLSEIEFNQTPPPPPPIS